MEKMTIILIKKKKKKKKIFICNENTSFTFFKRSVILP